MPEGIFVQIFYIPGEPRVDLTKKHLFFAIIGLALFAVLAGAQCYTEIESFCRHHHEWLKEVMKVFLENVVAIDSKSIKTSQKTRQNLKALHIVSA